MNIKRKHLATTVLGIGVLGIGVAFAACSSTVAKLGEDRATTSTDPVIPDGNAPRRRIKKTMRGSRLVGTVTVVTLLGVGVAFAVWSTTGSGAGTAQTTTGINSVIAAGASAADLYPGAAKTITVTISNPNPYPVLVTTISSGSSALVNGTCVAGTVTSDSKTDGSGVLQSDGTTRRIAASSSGTYQLVTHMTAAALDTCKSQTFTLALTSALSSDA